MSRRRRLRTARLPTRIRRRVATDPIAIARARVLNRVL